MDSQLTEVEGVSCRPLQESGGLPARRCRRFEQVVESSWGAYLSMALGIHSRGNRAARELNIPVAAVESANTYVVLGLLTDAIWKSMDSYSMWVGMPNGMVRRKLAKIYGFLRTKAPEGAIQERPPSEIETMFLGMAAALDELGFVHPKLVRRFRKHYVRRIDM